MTTQNEADGAELREIKQRISEIVWGVPNVLGTGMREEQLLMLFQSELSRLHSQIVEEVEKEINRDGVELMEEVIDTQSYLEGLEKAKLLINQAFKNLS